LSVHGSVILRKTKGNHENTKDNEGHGKELFCTSPLRVLRGCSCFRGCICSWTSAFRCRRSLRNEQIPLVGGALEDPRCVVVDQVAFHDERVERLSHAGEVLVARAVPLFD